MDDCVLPKDMVMEIFLRIPVKSVFKFKCVSKECKVLLSENDFREKYKSKHPQSFSLQFSALFNNNFLQKKLQSLLRLDESELLKISSIAFCKESMCITSRSFIDKFGFFLGSSDGLILCGFPPFKLCVCNPVTDQWLELPSSPNNKLSDAEPVALGFLHDMAYPSYTVIRAGYKNNPSNLLEVETYSSVTRVWKESLLKGPIDITLTNHLFKTIGRFFYWVSSYFIVVHDPKAEHGYLWMIDTNFISRNLWNFQLGKNSDGQLLLGMLDGAGGFRVFQLQKPLHVYDPCKLVPSTEFILLMNFPLTPPPEIWEILNPKLLAFHPQDSRFLLIMCYPSFHWYNSENGDVIFLERLSSLYPLSYRRDMIPYFQPEWPPSPLI